MPSIIQVHNLRKTYGSVVAAHDISFAVHPSEIFGLLGPNAAGKTTTLECLEGIRQPDRATWPCWVRTRPDSLASCAASSACSSRPVACRMQ